MWPWRLRQSFPEFPLLPPSANVTLQTERRSYCQATLIHSLRPRCRRTLHALSGPRILFEAGLASRYFRCNAIPFSPSLHTSTRSSWTEQIGPYPRSHDRRPQDHYRSFFCMYPVSALAGLALILIRSLSRSSQSGSFLSSFPRPSGTTSFR